MRKPYEPWEDAYLHRTSGEISIKGQAAHLSRTEDSVAYRRGVLGIRVRQAPWHTGNQKESPRLMRGSTKVIDIELAARAAGMSYGKYVAQEGL